ncbi:MAG: ABC transporter ATP-binding protein [candidate division WOR-3 bacterium]|jgi:lipoprotein-releasing system ATP-binding protein
MNKPITATDCQAGGDEYRVLIAVDIWRSFKTGPERLEVLKGINLEVRKGELVAIVGPSGSGKSTLLHILGGLDRPDRGQVILDSCDIFDYPEARLPELRSQKVGFVFQFHHLLSEFTVLENVAVPLLITGMERKKALKRAAEVLNEVGFSTRLQHRPAELSGGERALVAVARALANSPAIVFADEPTGNLDARATEVLMNLLVRLCSNGRTILVVTHNERVAQAAGRKLLLQDGRLV